MATLNNQMVSINLLLKSSLCLAHTPQRLQLPSCFDLLGLEGAMGLVQKPCKNPIPLIFMGILPSEHM